MMIRNLRNEEWREVHLNNRITKEYVVAVSNYGRVMRIVNGVQKLSNISYSGRYPAVSVKLETGKHLTVPVHRFVAEQFVKRDNDESDFVIHLDYDKENNKASNLKWTTKKEMLAHQHKGDIWRNAIKNKNKNYYKLNEGKVKIIKRQLKNKKNRITMIARRFGVSDMQIHRIKTGENWSHVTID